MAPLMLPPPALTSLGDAAEQWQTDSGMAVGRIYDKAGFHVGLHTPTPDPCHSSRVKLRSSLRPCKLGRLKHPSAVHAHVRHIAQQAGCTGGVSLCYAWARCEPYWTFGQVVAGTRLGHRHLRQSRRGPSGQRGGNPERERPSNRPRQDTNNRLERSTSTTTQQRKIYGDPSAPAGANKSRNPRAWDALCS